MPACQITYQAGSPVCSVQCITVVWIGGSCSRSLLRGELGDMLVECWVLMQLLQLVTHSRRRPEMAIAL